MNIIRVSGFPTPGTAFKRDFQRGHLVQTMTSEATTSRSPFLDNTALPLTWVSVDFGSNKHHSPEGSVDDTVFEFPGNSPVFIKARGAYARGRWMKVGRKMVWPCLTKRAGELEGSCTNT